MTISVVIPTYKRAESLFRLLHALDAQELRAEEIIIVSADPNFFPASYFQKEFPDLPIQLLRTIPSVCLQRNRGIDAARGEYVLLCDDDIEIPPNYLSALGSYLDQNKEVNIASGLVLEKMGEKLISEFPPGNYWSLLFRRFFLLGVWGSVNEIKTPGYLKFLQSTILKYYRKKGNTETSAGWPLLTNFDGKIIKTKFYGLGASLVRRMALGINAFDTVLDRSGIGDNYGVALKVAGSRGIHVLKDVKAIHHREGSGRVSPTVGHVRRVLAMDYFVQSEGRNWKKRGALLWSLFGNCILQTKQLNFRMVFANIRILRNLIIPGNPYKRAKRNGKEFCSPAASSGISIHLRLRTIRLAIMRAIALPFSIPAALISGRFRKNNVCMFHTGRVGSTVIADLLGQHSKVYWAGEIYVKLFWHQKTRTFQKGTYKNNTAVAQLRKDMLGRIKKYYGIECKFFHLKWLGQDMSDFVRSIRKLGYRKFIVLERKNYLKVIISHLASLETGQWHLHLNKANIKPSFYVDTNNIFFDHEYLGLTELLDSFSEDLAQIRGILKNENLDLLELEYERDIEKDPMIAYQKCLKFLGLSPSRAKIRFQKTTPFRWEDVVKNPEEVYAELRGTRYEWMLEEALIENKVGVQSS